MKLLLDQNISKRIVKPLQKSYPGTSQVFLENMETADDRSIWFFAKKNDFIIVTKDSDFHEFALTEGPPPKVILLKCGNQSNQYILDVLISVHKQIKEFVHDKKAAFLEIF